MLRPDPKIVVVAGGVLLFLAVGLVLALPSLVDMPRIQGLLREEATRLLDRPVRFERLSLGYWPLPAIHARGLTVANAPGFGPDPMLAVEDARVRIRLLPLLRGRLQLGEVTLERPRLVVEQRRDGTWNLPSPGGGRPGPAAPLILVSRVRLTDGRLEVRLPEEAGAASVAHLVDRIDVALEDLGWSTPMRFRVAARLPGGGLTLGVDGQAGPLAAAGGDLAALPARFTARLTAEEPAGPAPRGFALSGRGEGELRAEGPLGRMIGGGHLRLARLVVGLRPAACAGRPARPLVLEAVDLPVTIAGPRVTIDPFTLRVGGGTARGSAILTWRAGVPGVRLADVHVQGVAAEPILVDFLCQPYAVTGRLDAAGEGSFTGTGADLLRSATGAWEVQVGAGRLVGPALLTLVAGAVRVGAALYSVATLDAPGSLLASPLEFDTLSAAGTVGGGQLRVRQLEMQGRHVRVTGRGAYGLLDTRLDFDVRVQTGRSTFGVRLGGTAQQPSYQPAARDLLRGVADALGALLPELRKRGGTGGAPAAGR